MRLSSPPTSYPGGRREEDHKQHRRVVVGSQRLGDGCPDGRLDNEGVEREVPQAHLDSPTNDMEAMG